MRYRIILLILLFLATNCCFAATIVDEAGLRAAAATAGNNTIKANTTYALTDICLFKGSVTDGNMSFTVDTSAGDGNVEITNDGTPRSVQVCAHAHNVPIIITFTGTAASPIVFNSNTGVPLQVSEVYGDWNDTMITATFNYCYFKGQLSAGDGFNVGGAVVNPVALVFNNCKAFNNTGDGFSFLADNGTPIKTMVLNNCASYWNNNINNGGGGTSGLGAGDGVTAHSPNQTIIMNNGNFYQNGKSGIAIVGGGTLIVHDANIYDNGYAELVNNNGYQVYMEGTSAHQGVCQIYHSNIYNEVAIAQAQPLGFANMNVTLHNNIIDAANCNVNDPAIAIDGNCSVNFRGNIFKNNRTLYNYFINGSLLSSGEIANNDFINNVRDVNMATPALQLYNNIFFKMAGDANAINCFTTNAYTNSCGGYNCFYGLATATNYFKGDNGLKTTDIIANPLFKDKDANDFSLWGSSYCINRGMSTQSGGSSTIGAWQPKKQNSSVILAK
ncbi:MAG: hypothetical protein WBL85_04945 [Sedimentisphaerales bacterium]